MGTHAREREHATFFHHLFSVFIDANETFGSSAFWLLNHGAGEIDWSFFFICNDDILIKQSKVVGSNSDYAKTGLSLCNSRSYKKKHYIVVFELYSQE